MIAIVAIGPRILAESSKQLRKLDTHAQVSGGQHPYGWPPRKTWEYLIKTQNQVEIYIANDET